MSYQLLAFGSGEFGLPVFRALATDLRFSFRGVVTQPPKPRQRGQQIQPTPVGRWAQEQDLETISPASLRGSDVAQQISSFQADLFLVISYGLILPPKILQLPLHGSVNVHASLLPKYRGPAPIPATILAGDTTTGVTLMVVDKGIDTGQILGQYRLSVAPDDTSLTLADKLSSVAAQIVPDIVSDWLAGRRRSSPQPTTGISYAPKINRDDGHATWDSARGWQRKIRAFQPWPGVWAMWRGQRVKLLAADVIVRQPDVQPGTVAPLADGRSWAIACDDGWLQPRRLQFSGHRPQSADTIPGSYPGWLGSKLE